MFSISGNDTKDHLREATADVFGELELVQYLQRGLETIRVELFLTGDLMAISAVMGHDGVTSSFPCIYCKVPQRVLRSVDDYQVVPVVERTTSGLYRDAESCRGTFLVV